MNSTTQLSDSVKIVNEPEACHHFAKMMQSLLLENHYNSSDVFAISLALKEALHNATEHGRQLRPDKKIRVEYLIDKDRVELNVTDQGTGFRQDNVQAKRMGPEPCAPNGRGVLLMNAYMDEVAYNERGNAVHMVRNNRMSEAVDCCVSAA